MKGTLFIDNDIIGVVNFSTIDETMGATGGYLITNETYKIYQPAIQQHVKNQGISNSTHFNFRIVPEDQSELKPQGGIGITDCKEFDEIYVEAAGLDFRTMDKIKSKQQIN